MTRTLIAAVFLIAILDFAVTTAPPAGAEEPARSASPVVVELFTSQGCSSCPPADQLLAGLNEIAAKHQLPIYCLSFHVDYWNSLGWRDPYSAKQFTERQRHYAAAFQSGRVYTPQMIVNGETEFVGSRAKQAREVIESALDATTTATIDLKASYAADDGTATVDFHVAGRPPGSVLSVALVQRNAHNEIPRGENAGRELAHVQVVRAFKVLPLQEPSGTVRLGIPAGLSAQDVRVVAYVQDSRSMAMLGANSVDF